MAILNIVTYPDPLLRAETEPVTEVDDSVRQLINDMLDTMYSLPGVGLAAPQVGSNKQIIVYDIQRKDLEEGVKEEDKEGLRNPSILMNPEVVLLEGSYNSEKEGCLSFPYLRINVKRAKKIYAKGLDINGELIQLQADNLAAVVLQHEIDHLNGVLLIDKVGTIKREMYRRSQPRKRNKNKKKKKKKK